MPGAGPRRAEQRPGPGASRTNYRICAAHDGSSHRAPATEPITTTAAVTATVEQSGAALAKSISGGIAVTSTEDVTTPRTHHGGEYHSVATSDAVSFHPYLTTDTASSSYQGLVYTGGLLRLDEKTLEYIPNMAESYTISPDGLTFTFHLRHNMLWSDGQPITANDFKWTYDQVKNPDNAFPYLSQLDFINSYEALDDYTLQMKIKEVYAPALGQISGLIVPLPKHVWEKLDWSDPAEEPRDQSSHCGLGTLQAGKLAARPVRGLRGQRHVLVPRRTQHHAADHPDRAQPGYRLPDAEERRKRRRAHHPRQPGRSPHICRTSPSTSGGRRRPSGATSV